MSLGTDCVLLGVSAAIAIGCSSHSVATGPEAAVENPEAGGDGSIQASVSGVASAVSSLTWSLGFPGALPFQTGNVTLKASGSITFEITGVPAGSDYQLGFDGYSADRTTKCSCSAGLSVVASATTHVTESTICTSRDSDGGLGIDGSLADASHED